MCIVYLVAEANTAFCRPPINSCQLITEENTVHVAFTGQQLLIPDSGYCNYA